MAGTEPKATVVLQLEDENKGWRDRIVIDDPGVVPATGDYVYFADRNWIVIERSIHYQGTLGPDKQAVVTVLLRDRFKASN